MKFTLYTSDYIGKPQNTVYPNKTEIISAEDMKKAIAFDHVCAKYKNSRRANDNFICADVVSLECDNDAENPEEWITPKKLEELLSDVNFVIVGSRHNMKLKGKKSARPRFHVFFPISTYDDAGNYSALKKQIYSKFPFFDGNALDAARFYFGCETEEILWHEGEISIEDYLFFMQDNAPKIQQGQRNSTLSRFAGRAVKRFGAMEKAFEVFQREAEKCEPPLSEEELGKIWESACRFAKKVQSQEGYIPPEKYEELNQTLKPEDYSDIGQARVIAREYGDELMHTSATDILRYNGIFWEESRQKAVGAVIEFLDLQLADAQQQYAESLQNLVNTGLKENEILSGGKKFAESLDEEQTKLYSLFLGKKVYLAFVMKRRDMKYILSAMQALKPMIDCPVSELDSDPFLLNTPSATYDVRFGMMGALDHDAGHKITKVTAFDPSDKGKNLWLDALDEFFCKDAELIDYVQKMMGLSILGKVFIEALLILYGEGGNGKSTFGNAILKSLGKYGGVISADALTVGCKRNVKPELAEAKGKRILIAAELEEGMRLNTSIVKQLCSTDEIEAEKKYKDPFNFTPTHTLLLYTNHLPKIGATDDGIWRRLIVIPFNAKIQPKKDIKNYADYLVENAGQYIIKWLIEGAEKIINDNFRIVTPQCVQDAVKAYRSANDWLAHFMEECCEIQSGRDTKSGGLMDLYAEFRLLDMGQRLGRFIGNFRTEYFTPDKRNGMVIYSYKPLSNAEQQIYKKISDITISMKSTDFLKMPELILSEYSVNLSSKEIEHYRKFKKDLILEIPDGEITAANAASLSNKLSQMANGAIYDDTHEIVKIHDRKLDALEDLIEAQNGKPLLVAYWFKHDLERIAERLEKLKILFSEINTSESLKRWNNGKIPVGLIHPMSAGHGLNLQSGRNTLVWFGLTWSLELYQQTNARLWRQGQKSKTVIIQHIITKNTVDERILSALQAKNETQSALLEAVKAELEEENGTI